MERAADPAKGPVSKLGPVSRGGRESRGAVGRRRADVLPIQSLLTRCHGLHLPFEWSLNPYRGCAFACRYCYARYTHVWLGLDPDSGFDRRVFLKRDVARVLERDLARFRHGRHAGERIAIGTATDPYQPLERRFGLTRACLEVFLRESAGRPADGERSVEGGHRLSITTKSDLVARDVDLLKKLSVTSEIRINVTVTTLNRELGRLLEPGAPTPRTRLATMVALRRAGIPVTAFVMPILPGLTDSEPDLDALFSALAAIGVAQVVCEAVFLRSPSREVFLSFLHDRFPELEEEYRRRFGDGAYCPPLYVERLRARVARLRERHGLSGPLDAEPETRPYPPPKRSRFHDGEPGQRESNPGGEARELGRGFRSRRIPRLPRRSPPVSPGPVQLQLFDESCFRSSQAESTATLSRQTS